MSRIAISFNISQGAAHHYLTLPFPSDPQMKIAQGWYYNTPLGQQCSFIQGIYQNPSNKDNSLLHCGNDYYKQASDGSWVNFPVAAAADGLACWNCISIDHQKINQKV